MFKNSYFYSFLTRGFHRAALVAGFASAVWAQDRPSAVPKPADVTRWHILSGNTRPEANEENDRGPVPDTFAMNHLLLELKRSPQREAALESFIDELHNPASPNFHKWLTASQFGELYGPAAAETAAVSDWLRSYGFTVNTVYPSGMSIDFSGTAGQVQSAFGTEIHRLSVNGVNHIANMSDPRIPDLFTPLIAGIFSLHDFSPPNMTLPVPRYTIQVQLVVPADLAVIYDLKPAFAAGYTGQGQTVAVIEDSDLFDSADWYTFRTALGLASYKSGSFKTINPPPPSGANNCTDPGANSDDDEATLDAEWASAAAPNAAIQLVSCAPATTTPGFMLAALNIINSKQPPQIMSLSYGYCEAVAGVTANAGYNSTYQQAAVEGVSVFVAAGDSGAAGCDHGSSNATHGIGVSATASTPYNVAVGGTDFGDTAQGTNSTYWGPANSSTFGSALSYIPEIPWNDSCAGSVLAAFWGYSVGYGSDGFCGSALAGEDFAVTTAAGSGGPSGCASGVPSENLVVGGTCKGYAKPSWQTGVSGIPNDGVRDVPDVALFAANGLWGHSYVFCFSDLANGGAKCAGPPELWSGAGGTSFASPIMAGIQALVNQKMGAAQGNPNPVYYKLAASSVASSVFHSITTGDIAVNCSGDLNCFGSGFVGRGRAAPVTSFVGNGGLSTSSQTYTPAFAASAGWNFATGLGSVDAFNLIMNWSQGQ